MTRWYSLLWSSPPIARNIGDINGDGGAVSLSPSRGVGGQLRATPDAARLSGESLVRTGHFDDEESAPRKGAPDGSTDVDAGLMTRAVGTYA